MEAFEQKLLAIEKKIYFEHDLGSTGIDVEVNDEIRRVLKDVETQLCFSAKYKWVPSNYYSLELKERAKLLSAPSEYQLCKAMLMENVKCEQKGNDKTNSRLYLVIVQYKASIDTKQLESEVRGLRSIQSGKRLDPSQFEFRMASQETSDKVTGFTHNSVSPFGLSQKIPIILSKQILDIVEEPAFIWMGGGHINLKLGMAVKEFVRATDALVLDVSK